MSTNAKTAAANTPVTESSLVFTFHNPKTGEVRTVSLTQSRIQELLTNELYDELATDICECQSVGETNVVDCDCGDYVDDFELQGAV